MTSIRQERFARLIQKELGYYFLSEGKKIFGNVIISVTHVIMSPDLGYAKIYVSFLNQKEPKPLMEKLELHNREIHKALIAKIRNELRKMPDIAFFYDDTLDYMEKIDEVFKKIHKEDDEKK